MESLAYLHLSLANEAPTSPDYTASISWENPKLVNWLKQRHLPTGAVIRLLSVTIAIGVIGTASYASAAVRQGDRGYAVTTLQQQLQQLGYFEASATGYFGPLTKEAVIRFQEAQGLTPDGIVGTQTLAAIDEKLLPRTQVKSQSSQRVWRIGDRGEQVGDIQAKLAMAGLRPGAKGIFDGDTQEAVRQFQQEKGLTVDGVVGRKTMAALSAIEEQQPLSQPRQTYDEQPLSQPRQTYDEQEPMPEPTKNNDWFEDNSAPDSPFIQIPE